MTETRSARQAERRNEVDVREDAPSSTTPTVQYDDTQELTVSADEAFAFLSDVANLPRYLPPITEAHTIDGEVPEVPEVPEVHMEGHGPDGDAFAGEGPLRIDREARRMEWSSEITRAYSGWLTVADAGDGQSAVQVHLEFGPRSAEPEIQRETDEDRDPTAEALRASLETIRRQLEGEGGQEDLPPLPDRARDAARATQERRPDVTAPGQADES